MSNTQDDLDKRLFGASMTYSWAISEHLQDKLTWTDDPEGLKKSKRRMSGRLRACAKRFGFANVEAMRQAIRERAEKVEKQ